MEHAARNRSRKRKRDDRKQLHIEPLEARIAPATTNPSVLLGVQLLGVNDLDNDGVADPGEVLHYTVTITNGASAITLTNLSELINDPNLTLVAGSFNVQPIALDDSFNAVGNTLLRVGGTADPTKPEVFVSGGSVTANDVAIDDAFTLTPLNNVTTTLGGKVTLLADGTFTYISEAGDTGTDSFTYTITDTKGLSNTATVSIALNGKIWYVDNSGANGTGTSQSPFNTLAGAQTASGIGDTIYVAGGAGAYANTSLTLKNSQTLIGAGSALQFTLPAGTPTGLQTLKAVGTTPTLTSAGTAITLGSGNSLRGFQVGDTGIDIAGNNFGTLSVNNVTLTGTGKALDLVTGSFAAGSTFNGVTSTSSSTHGLLLQSVGGSVNFGATTISNATGPNIFVTTSTATIDFGVTSTTGGSAEGLRLENNPNASLTFSSIQVTDAGTIGIHHTGDGGPMTVTGATTITNSGSFGLVVQSTAVGHNVVFANVTETGSGNTGVLLGQAGTPNAGNVTFARLNIAPDAGVTALSSTNGTGTITTTSGTITATGAGRAIDINGPAGMTPLALTLTQVNGAGGANNIRLSNVSGTASLGSGTLTGATSAAFVVGDGASTASTGGTAAITYSGAITTAGTVRAVDIQDRRAGAGNISLNGRIQHTSGDANVIFVDTVPAGTITFSGANNNFSGGTSNAVNLTNNAGATISFSGSNMTIATTSGTGFNATGGGTINVFGLGGNTITSTTGAALNVANTTIGVSGLNFQSITAGTTTGSAGVGISLDNTGSSGGLTVTGSGTAGSGGTIQHKTGADGSTTSGIGIYLNNTSHVSLSRMQLNDFDNSAIRGFSVTHFTLTNSVINGVNGNASGPTEGAITFGTSNPSGANGLLGTGANASLIDNVDVSGAVEHTIEVYNQSGSFGLTISNSNIHDNSVALGGDGIQMEMQGTATATVLITGNQFSNNKSQAIQLAANDDSTFNATIRGNTITRGTQGNEGIVLSNGSNGDLTAMIGGPTLADGNTISGFGGVSIFVGQTPGNATASSLLQATIQNNTVTTVASATNHAVIAFLSSTTGVVSQAKLLIDSNTINQLATGGVSRAILVDAPDTGRTPEYHATVTNNNVDINDGGTGTAVTAIAVQARNGATGHFDVRNNDVDFISAQPGGVVGVRVRDDASSNGELARGVSASNDPVVVVAANNTTASGTEILGTITVINNGIVQLPASPSQPLFFAPSANDPVIVGPIETPAGIVPPTVVENLPASSPVVDVPGVVQPPAGIEARVVQPPVIIDDGILSQAELDSLVGAAIARWEAAGITPEQSALLHSVRFSVEDLPGWYLGEARAGNVVLDRDAAGNSWFVDSTPLSDEEFENNGGQLSATSGAAAGRLDALTTIVHELGHQLGLDDTYASTDANKVMYGYLHQSERRLPAAHEADGADASHLALQSGPDFLFTPMSLANAPLGANKTLTIVFDATIKTFSNSELVPNSVSTQVRLAYNDGTAKTVDSLAAVTTVDSLTLGNLVFRDNNTNGVFDAGDAGVNGVTLSLFVDADDNNVADTPSTPLATTTTAGGGLYSFTNLAPGNYLVRVDQANFNVGGPLEFLPLATTFGGDPDIGDPDTDDDNNAQLSPGNGAVTQSITLAFNTEPTALGGPGNDTNNTLDLGFTPILADLAVTKTDGVTSAVAGGSTTYTITVSNAGPNTVVGANITDNFDFGKFSSVSWTSSANNGATGNTASGSTNISDTVTMPSGSTVTYVVMGNILSGATGNLVNTANVVAPGGVTDTNLANNGATDTDTIVKQADLVITKTDNKTSSAPGVQDTYTIVVSNVGPSDVGSLNINDTFDTSKLSNISWTTAVSGGATVTTPAGNGNISTEGGAFLPSGGSITYTVTATILAGATGVISNTATVNASGYTETNNANNSATDTTTIITDDLSITKTDGSETAVPGSTVTYTVRVTNGALSTQAANGATVADVFDTTKLTNINLLSFSTTNGSSTNASLGTVAGGNFNATVNLPIDTYVEFTFSANVLASATGSLANTATITAPGGFNEADTSNNSATDTDNLTPQFDLAITKTDLPDPVVAGQEVTYTINLAKTGASDAGGVVINDVLPAGLTFVSATPVGGWSVTDPGVGNNGTVTFTKLATMTNSEAPVFTIVAKVAASVASGTVISNTAGVSSSGFDTNDGNNSGTATTTVNALTDITVDKSGTEGAVAGNNVTYTINVRNNGPSDAQTVDLTDALPAGTTFVSLSTPGGWSATTPAVGSNGQITASTPTLAAGATATFTLVANVSSNVVSGTILNNTASATTATSESDSENNAATALTNISTLAELTVTKTDSPDPVTAGTDVTYTITVNNSGPSDARTVSLTDVLPAGLSFVSLSTPGGWSATTPAVGANGTITMTNDDLAPGSAVFTLVAHVGSEVAGGAVIDNTAAVTTATSESDSENNSASSSTTVVSIADLSITKTDSPDPVHAGDNITFTIGLTNIGPSVAGGVTVSDVLPASMTFVSANYPGFWNATLPAVGSGGTVTFSLDGVGPGSFTSFTIVAKVPSNAPANSNISNTVTATTTSTDPNPSNDTATSTTTTDTLADLEVTKTAPGAVAPGTNITYTIDLANVGPSDAQNIMLSDVLPAGTTFVSAAAPGGWTAFVPAVGAGGAVTFTAPSEAAGASATFTIVVNTNVIPAGTNVSNSAVATSTTAESDTEDNTSTAVTVVGGVDLVVTKENVGNDDVVIPGETITYTINYSNSGFQNAPGVVLTETLPTGTTFVSAGSTAGWTETAPGSGVFKLNVGTLPGTGSAPAQPENGVVSGSGTATFVVSVIGPNVPAGLDNIVNTTTIDYDGSQGADTNGADNTATDTDALNAAPDLAITKTTNLVSVPRGTALSYTVTYANNGNQAAAGVELHETVPAGSVFNPATSDGDWILQGDGSYKLIVGNLAAGASDSVVFGVIANQFGPNQLVNNATINDDSANGADQDSEDNSASLSTPIYQGIYAVSAGRKLTGERGVIEPRVRVYDVATGTEVLDFLAYEPKATAGVFTAIGDFNDDGFDDIVTSIGKGSGRIRLWDGLTGERMNIGTLAEIAAFNKTTGRGGGVAVGDVTGDGTPDIFIANGYLGTTVKAYNGDTGALIRTFKPFGNSAVGVHVATGDFNGDGRDDLVTSRGDGRRVRVFSGMDFATALVPTQLLDLTRPVGKAFAVSAGDVNGDGRADLIFGSGPNRPAEIAIYSTITNSVGTPISLGAADPRAGVSVATANIDLDPLAEIIATAGPKLGGSVRFFEGTGTEYTDRDFQPFPERPSAVLFVSGSRPPAIRT